MGSLEQTSNTTVKNLAKAQQSSDPGLESQHREDGLVAAARVCTLQRCNMLQEDAFAEEHVLTGSMRCLWIQGPQLDLLR